MATIDLSRPTLPRLTNRNREILQAVRVVLGTRPGTFEDAPEYGFDPDEALLDAITGADAARLPLQLKSAIEADERIDRVELDGGPVVEHVDGAGVVISVNVLVYPVDGGEPAPLTISVDQVSLKVLERGGIA